MGFRRTIIQSNRSLCGRHRLWKRLIWRKIGIFGEHSIRLCDPRIRQGIAWLFLNRLTEELDCFIPSLPSPFVSVVSPLDIQLIGLGVRRYLSRKFLPLAIG